MKTRLFPLLLTLMPAGAGANFFTLNVTPAPAAIDLAACPGDDTPFQLNFFIADLAGDGVVVRWEWEILPAETGSMQKPPEISTDASIDNVSGVLSDGGQIGDMLNIDLSKADGGSYLLRLTVTTQGAEPEQTEELEYPVYVDVVGTNDFAIEASLDRRPNGDVLLCEGQSVRLSPNLLEKPGLLGPYLYTWTGPEGFTAATAAVEVSTPGRYELTVSNACGASVERIDLERRTSFELEVDASARKTNGHAVLCESDPVALFPAEAEDSQFAPYTYQWQGPGDLSADTRTLETTTTGLHRLTVTNACGEGKAQIQVDGGGIYPIVDNLGVTYPPDLAFRACPAPAGVFVFRVEPAGPADAYDYEWQVQPPGTTGYQPIAEKTARELSLPVDETTHLDGSTYRVLADNNGCQRFIPADPSTDPPPQTMQLLVLPAPVLTPMLTDAVIDVEERLTYETTLTNPFGESSFIQWELEDETGGAPPIPLGPEVDVAEASLFEGSALIPRTGKVLDWQVSITPDEAAGTVTTRLALTNTAGGEADTELAVRIHAYHKDDNNFLLTGIPRMDCTLTTEEAGIIALPIELLFFRAAAGDHSIFIRWATATEVDNDYFTLERSADGTRFTPIAEVDGAGTSYHPNYYEYTDQRAPAGLLYYRLRQTDFDGRYSYSEVVAVDRPDQPSAFQLIRTVPSPGRLYYEYFTPDGGEVFATLYDAAGRLLLRRTQWSKKGFNGHSLDLPGLSAGIYILHLRRGGEQAASRFMR